MNFGWNQFWGCGVIVVGIVWLLKQNIPIGIEGRPPIFWATGKTAVSIGVLAIILGLIVTFRIPSRISKHIAIDKCLDGGGKFDYKNESCTRKETIMHPVNQLIYRQN